MDISLVISLVALVFSVISPVLASVIAGWFQLRQKKLEIKAESEKRKQDFFDLHRAEVIENYIRAVGRICNMDSGTNLSDFGTSMGEIYLYVDESLWPLLDSIARKAKRVEYENPSDDLQKLCKALAGEHLRN